MILEEVKIPLKVKRIINELNKSGYEAYIVGGCVRDMLLGLEPKDYDICTSAEPKQTLEVMKNAYIPTSSIGIAFGTVEAYIGEDSFEITTYRSESNYTNGRHPAFVEFEKDIKKDLSRRDFTINAMALNVNTLEIIDPFNGQEDLENKLIRAVGNPDDRIKEDYLRMLRALRFSIRFEYNIEENLAKSIMEHSHLVSNLSKERITNELTKILSLNKPVYDKFIEFRDLIAELIPPIRKCIGFNQNNKYHKHDVYRHMLAVTDNCDTDNPLIKFAALLHDIGKPNRYSVDEHGNGHFYGHPEVSAQICEKLLKENFRFTVEDYNTIITLVRYHDLEVFLTRKNVKKLLNRLGEDNFKLWMILKQADIDDHIYISENNKYIRDISPMKDIYEEIMTEKQCFSLKNLEVNGRDLIKELKITQGKLIGIILQALLTEVINEEITNNKDELLKEAKRLYSENKVLWSNQCKH